MVGMRLVEGHATRERPFVFKRMARIWMARLVLLPPGCDPEREPIHHILQHGWLSILIGLRHCRLSATWLEVS